jgi:hypothetical protein
VTKYARCRCEYAPTTLYFLISFSIEERSCFRPEAYKTGINRSHPSTAHRSGQVLCHGTQTFGQRPDSQQARSRQAPQTIKHLAHIGDAGNKPERTAASTKVAEPISLQAKNVGFGEISSLPLIARAKRSVIGARSVLLSCWLWLSGGSLFRPNNSTPAYPR